MQAAPTTEVVKSAFAARVLDEPIRAKPQEKNRYRFWAAVPELEGRYLRVITLEDKLTIHNAAFSRSKFKP